ncbi:MAG: sigma-54-dependent transcriptional regulator [Luminiphilus sp.]
MTRACVLLVDDEPDLLTLLEMTLGRMDLDTRTASTLREARASLGELTPDLCLTDMKLPDGNGLELIAEIQQRYPDLPVAMMTAHGSVETAIEALKLGAFDFVSKPLALDKLRDLVTQALKLSAVRDAPTDDTLIGETPVMATLKRDILRLARSQAPVHIHGESGVGKEVVARLIHESGPRSAGPFLAINCGAIPAELVESELFGHRKGSFTGATADKPGLFQAASAGTLLLDEIADLPLPVQVKLLRVIQEKAVRPIGEQKEIPVDVRLMSATHKSLLDEVRGGRFREDLYYRINVIDLTVPPLRNRRADIPLISAHILKKMPSNEGDRPLRLSDRAAARLMAHEFPGNIRELENILARAAALLEGHVIDTADLELDAIASPESSGDAHAPDDAANPEASTEAVSGDLDGYLSGIERTIIEEALQTHRWNRTATAKSLGITLRSLRYRLKKLGIED